MIKHIDFSDEVLQARKNQKPIVALESTIISHGMPYPDNVAVARKCEAIVREHGAVPATIAIIKGRLKIGLNDDDLEYFGKQGTKIHKVSRRDIAYVVSNSLDGATTVSATMFIASLGDIKVFATGGIGGVHRDATNTFDISADLLEFAQTNVSVVSAGAKAILDLGLTLEYLETNGVEVIGYQTDKLPAFYTKDSDFFVNFRCDTPSSIASMIKTKEDLGLKSGMLIANPIPEEYSLDKDYMNYHIEEAIKKMNDLGIKGKDTTPFLLGEIVSLTKGKSLEANKALVYNNCKVAAKIAVAYNEIGD